MVVFHSSLNAASSSLEVVAPRLVERRQPAAEVLPCCQIGGAAGGAAGSSCCGAQWKLQLLHLMTATIDAEEVPSEAPVADGGGQRAVRNETKVDRRRVGEDAATTGGGGDAGVYMHMEVKIGRGLLHHHPRLQEGRQLLVREEEGIVRVLCGRNDRRRVGEREE